MLDQVTIMVPLMQHREECHTPYVQYIVLKATIIIIMGNESDWNFCDGQLVDTIILHMLGLIFPEQ